MRRYLALVGVVVFLASCSLLMIQGGAQVCRCPKDATVCLPWCPLQPCDHGADMTVPQTQIRVSDILDIAEIESIYSSVLRIIPWYDPQAAVKDNEPTPNWSAYQILIDTSEAFVGEPRVKFKTNGEVTDELEDGETDVLSGGVQIGILGELKVATPNIIAGATGATFSMSYDPSTGRSRVEVYEGTVYVSVLADMLLEEWEATPIDDMALLYPIPIPVTGDGHGNGQRFVWAMTMNDDGTGTASGVIEDLTDMDPADWEFPES